MAWQYLKQIGWILTLSLLVGIATAGGMTYGPISAAHYRGTTDGDTIRFDLPGVHPLLGANIAVRLRGVDTPERHAACPSARRQARAARDRVAGLLKHAQQITLLDTGRDKYFRIVARVVADGVDVGETLLREGLAAPYDGGRKSVDWCGVAAQEE